MHFLIKKHFKKYISNYVDYLRREDGNSKCQLM